jgi:hypothetical protein
MDPGVSSRAMIYHPFGVVGPNSGPNRAIGGGPNGVPHKSRGAALGITMCHPFRVEGLFGDAFDPAIFAGL